MIGSKICLTHGYAGGLAAAERLRLCLLISQFAVLAREGIFNNAPLRRPFVDRAT